MPAGKKGARGRFTPRDKKAYRYWYWLVIIGPALFFILYWLNTGAGEYHTSRTIPPPRAYQQAGEPATTGGKTLLAAPGGKVAYTRELLLGNNRVVAEGGSVFTVLPVIIPEGFNPIAGQWYIVSSGGDNYGLLKTLEQSPLEAITVSGTDRGSNVSYLIFKLDGTLEDLFLVYTAGQDYAAWKLPAGMPPASNVFTSTALGF